MGRKISLGYSTCPNDTFIFYALAHGMIDCGFDFDISLADVETLNQEASQGRLDVTKLSYAALGHLLPTYGLLRSGGALGRGCGPLIVARTGFELSDLKKTKIAVPGIRTTAHLLLGLFMGEDPRVTAMTFDEIMPAVETGDFDAGVIIHEGRFTYQQFGLNALADLGEWWERETGLPIPLGCIAARRDLGSETAAGIDRAIRDSVAYAFDHPEETRDYIREYAQEMADDVIQQHIDLYVNAFSLDVGGEGETAVHTLLERGRTCGVMPEHLGELQAY